MTDPDDVIAMLYEVGGRRDSHDSRLIRRGELDDLYAGSGDAAPVSESSARAAYLARKEARSARRGGGR